MQSLKKGVMAVLNGKGDFLHLYTGMNHISRLSL